jgi:hypothetical protein
MQLSFSGASLLVCDTLEGLALTCHPNTVVYNLIITIFRAEVAIPISPASATTALSQGQIIVPPQAKRKTLNDISCENRMRESTSFTAFRYVIL